MRGAVALLVGAGALGAGAGALGLATSAAGPALHTGRAIRPGGDALARLSGAERAAIAAALGYPYPLRCLRITVAAGSPDYARVNVERPDGCGRYRGYLNATLHRIGGSWRLVLDEGQLFVPNSRLAPTAPPAGRGRI